MWKFYSRCPRRFMIEVYSMLEGEITRYYVNQKDLSKTFQEAVDKYEDLRVNVNVYEILNDDWQDEEAKNLLPL